MTRTNVVVLSKNRAQKNETASFVDVSLSNALTCADNEYFSINVSSFNAIKSFYALQNNLNNKFLIVMKRQDGTEEPDEFPRWIPEGNYDVRTLMKVLQDLCFGYISIDYDRTLNKFIYQRSREQGDGEANALFYDMYIKPVDCGDVLGLKNGVMKLMSYMPTLSDTFVNISGYGSLLINLNGLSLANNYINHGDQYAISKMIGVIDIVSTRAMDSITYTDACNTCKYKINDKIIKEFALSITNEDGKHFPQMSNYIANILFEKHVNPVNYENLFSILMTRINDLIYFITYFLEYVGGSANGVQ